MGPRSAVWPFLVTVPALALAAALPACGLKSGAGDAGSAGPAASETAASAAAAEPEARNAELVTRFAAETRLGGEAATLERAMSNVRKEPPAGEIVATLPKGTAVKKVASYQGFVLVNFAAPDDANARLEGWIVKEAFVASAAPAAPKAPAKCAAGQTLFAGESPLCEKACKDTVECGAGSACTGVGFLAGPDGGTGAQSRFCVTTAKPDAGTLAAVVDAGAGASADAGAAKVVDASAEAPKVDGGSGAAKVADAGGAGTTSGTTAGATTGGGAQTQTTGGSAATTGGGAGGGGATTGAPRVFLVKPKAGKCDAGYTLASDGFCRIACSRDADCTPGFCKAAPSAGAKTYCSASK